MALSYYITARQQLASGCPGEDPKEVLVRTVRRAFAAGVDYVQLREKDLPASDLLQLAEELGGLPKKQTARLLVNERLDIAFAARADGVHLPSDSLPLPRVRAFAERGQVAGKIAGISCHTEEEVAQAATEGAAYALLSPIFETPSKPASKPLGLPILEEICREYPIPIFALGGVNAENAVGCVRAGAAGIAGIRLFQEAADLEALCQSIHAL